MPNWRLWLPPALEKPNVRRYAAGHVVSVLGGWIQQVALSWLVWRLSESVFLLGLTGFLLNISYLLFGGIAGVLIDRWPRLPFLIALDLILAAASLVLAAMVVAGVTDISAYLLVAAFIGIANGFEMPVRQSLFKDIVEDKHLLSSAIALSAMVFNLGRMIGPAIAGVLLLYVSEAWCFLANALSYAAIIIALLAMQLPSDVWARQRKPADAPGFWDSLAVIGGLPVVRYLLPTVAALGMFATSYVALMPSIAAHYFGGGASTVGLLMSSVGVGALASSSYLAMQPGFRRQLRLASAAPPAVGVLLIAFALSPWLVLSMLLLAGLGGCIMLSSNTINALLQQSTPDEWRGRVIGLYAMAFAGTAPLGSLLTGAMAAVIGLAPTLACNGLIVIAAGLIAQRRLHNHPEAMRSLVRALRS